MSLLGMQEFLTRYMRDPVLRNACRDDVRRAAEEKNFELSDEEIEQLRGIDLQYFERAANGIDEERRNKRESEFKRFFSHYALYADVEQFFARYIMLHTRGTLSRPDEMERFLAFAIRHVVNTALPRYLVDLARFDYHVVKAAAAPAEPTGGAIRERPRDGLEAYHLVSLRRPFRQVDFLFDAYEIARAEPCDRWASSAHSPTRLIIQPSPTHYKASIVNYSQDLPGCELLVEGVHRVEELIARIPGGGLAATFAQLESLAAEGVIDVFST